LVVRVGLTLDPIIHANLPLDQHSVCSWDVVIYMPRYTTSSKNKILKAQNFGDDLVCLLTTIGEPRLL
jgi:hypothetical protein